jgi:hypothetical protein
VWRAKMANQKPRYKIKEEKDLVKEENDLQRA